MSSTHLQTLQRTLKGSTFALTTDQKESERRFDAPQPLPFKHTPPIYIPKLASRFDTHLDDDVGIGEQPPSTRRYDNSPLELGLIQRGQVVALRRKASLQLGDSGHQVIWIAGRLFQSSQAVQLNLALLLLPCLSVLPYLCMFPGI